MTLRHQNPERQLQDYEGSVETRQGQQDQNDNDQITALVTSCCDSTKKNITKTK